MSTGSVTVITPRLIVEECSRRGIDQERLFADAGLPVQCLRDATGAIPVEKMYVLWEKVLQLSADEMFAVQAAERVPLGAYGVLDYMVMTSSSPKDALVRTSRFFGVFNTAFLLSLQPYRNAVCFELLHPHGSGEPPRPYIEYIFFNYLVRLRMATRQTCSPVEVQVTYARPDGVKDYDAVFGASVRFRQPANRLIFAACTMEMRHPCADPELCELFEFYAQKKMRQSQGTQSGLPDIRKALTQNLESGSPTLPAIARQLGKSRRCLQRDIAASGQTFRDVLDSVRQERAVDLLKKQDLPISEIAMKLNFSGPSAFSHAFRRWTGQSPQQYRKTPGPH